MSTPVTPNPAAAPSRSWPLRIAGFLTGTALLVLGLLVAIGYTLNALNPGGPVHPDVVLGICMAVLVALGVLAWKRVRLLGTWVRVAVGAALATVGIAWLAGDDPGYTHPITLEDLSGAAGDRAGESFELSLRYTEREGHSHLKFADPKTRTSASIAEKPDEWLAEIEKSRAGIEAEWERLAPEREWFDALDAYTEIGDDISAGFNAPVMRFAVYRAVTNLGSARAGLLAIDGRGDEAMAIVLRQLSVSDKLERNSRTLVRSMIAVGGWRDGLATAKFILGRTAVSPLQRMALAEMIIRREDHDRVLRRLVWLDFVVLRETALEQKETLRALMRSEMGTFGSFTSLMRPLMFLPNHTANLISGYLAKVEEAAKRRASKDDLDRLGVEFYGICHQDGPKNFGGKYLIVFAMPNLNRVIDRSWEVEDLRAEVWTALKASGAGGNDEIARKYPDWFKPQPSN